MQTIDSQRLQQIRISKGLSRQALARKADISERQIARIESPPSGAKQVRSNTMDRLARALDMSVVVLAGHEPLPGAAAGGVPKDALVDPQRLKALREGKGMSRRKLAKRSRVSERTIARIESSATTARGTTLKRLATALAINVETLLGDGPTGSEQPAATPTQLGFRVNPQLCLAYDLVSLRYGSSRRKIIELAPLLFTLLAEGSLAWRRQCLKEFEETMDRLEDLGKNRQLYFALFSWMMDDGHEMEKKSILKKEIFGKDIRSDGDYSTYGDFLDEVTPFSDYLCKLANDLEISGAIDVREAPWPVGVRWNDFDQDGGTYQVCRDVLEAITGGSKVARWVLAHGDVRLSDIPKELMKPDAKEERVAWLEEKESEATRQQRESEDRVLRDVQEQVGQLFQRPTETGTQEGGQSND